MGIELSERNVVSENILAYLGLSYVPEKKGVLTKAGKISQEGVIMLILFGDLNQWKFHAYRGESAEDIKFNDLIQDIFAFVNNSDFEGSMGEGVELETYNWVVDRLGREKINHASTPAQTTVSAL